MYPRAITVCGGIAFFAWWRASISDVLVEFDHDARKAHRVNRKPGLRLVRKCRSNRPDHRHEGDRFVPSERSRRMLGAVMILVGDFGQKARMEEGFWTAELGRRGIMAR